MGFDSVGTPLLWSGFIVFVLAMLALDLGIFHRKEHAVRFKEALLWSGAWVGLALLFNVGLWWKFGSQPGIEFLSGYLIEKSLSVDNIFVFAAIFSSFGIPALYQHRVLFWGILTALALRAVVILTGVAMLERFRWLIYIFGAFLILTGIRFFVQRNRESRPEESVAWRVARRVVPSTARLESGRFLTVENEKWLATPLLLALVLIESADVVFALDSIPAVFAITSDPFIIFTSNIFAMLGLRSMFFLVAGAIQKVSYLKVGLSAVLVFVGVKMTLSDVVKASPAFSLGVISILLGASIGASILRKRSPLCEQLLPRRLADSDNGRVLQSPFHRNSEEALADGFHTGDHLHTVAPTDIRFDHCRTTEDANAVLSEDVHQRGVVELGKDCGPHGVGREPLV